MLKIFLRNAGVKRHLFRRRLEKSIVVDVPNNQLGCLTIDGVEHRLVKLPHQMLLKGLLRGD